MEFQVLLSTLQIPPKPKFKTLSIAMLIWFRRTRCILSLIIPKSNFNFSRKFFLGFQPILTVSSLDSQGLNIWSICLAECKDLTFSITKLSFQVWAHLYTSADKLFEKSALASKELRSNIFEFLKEMATHGNKNKIYINRLYGNLERGNQICLKSEGRMASLTGISELLLVFLLLFSYNLSDSSQSDLFFKAHRDQISNLKHPLEFPVDCKRTGHKIILEFWWPQRWGSLTLDLCSISYTDSPWSPEPPVGELHTGTKVPVV